MAPGGNFLRVDGHPAKRQMLREGRVLVWPATGGGTTNVPSGLLHHWVGTIFIPDATLDQALAVVRDFDSYKDRYSPSVIGSKLLRHEGDDYEFRLRFQKTLLMETVDHGLHLPASSLSPRVRIACSAARSAPAPRRLNTPAERTSNSFPTEPAKGICGVWAPTRDSKQPTAAYI